MVVHSRPRLELAYDVAERVFIAAMGLWIIWRFWPSLADAPINGLFVASECAAVLMIVFRRRAGQVDLAPRTIVIALIGTTGVLLVSPGGEAVIPSWLGGMVIVAGSLLNIAAKISLNRSFGMAAANRGVQRQGPYRFMRHPMYAAYFVTQVAFLGLNPTLWNLCVYLAAWSAQLLRIQAEERVLGEDPAYRAYSAKVPFRLIPGIY